jgi:hypothetical protein
LTQRQELVGKLQQTLPDSKEKENKIREHPDVLVINKRLLELTSPEGISAFQEVGNLVEKSTMVYDRRELNTDQENNLSEGMNFIQAEQKKIIGLRRSLVTEIIPQIKDKKARSIIENEVSQFDDDYQIFQKELEEFDDKDDLQKVQAKFVSAFADWYDRLHDIFIKAQDNDYQKPEVNTDSSIFSITELEQRNDAIWNKLVSATFEPTVAGIREKFILIIESIDEYKADIKTCLGFLSSGRKIYYEKQMADLDKQISDLLAQKESTAQYSKLLKISSDVLDGVEQYRHLHTSCVHEVSKKST